MLQKITPFSHLLVDFAYHADSEVMGHYNVTVLCYEDEKVTDFGVVNTEPSKYNLIPCFALAGIVSSYSEIYEGTKEKARLLTKVKLKV